MNTFEEMWSYLQSNLKSGTEISNWTAFNGCLGDKMTISRLRHDYVEVDTAGARMLQVVPKEDFHTVYNIWADYKTQKIPRHEIRDMTRFSKYIISILHWYDGEVNKN